MKIKREFLGLGIFFTFLSGFIAAEIACSFKAPIVELPGFIFASVVCLIIGFIFLSTKGGNC